MRLDPLLVSSSESLESRYEESESDSSLLTSSELEAGRTEALWAWLAVAVVTVMEGFLVPGAAREESGRGLLEEEAATPPPRLL